MADSWIKNPDLVDLGREDQRLQLKFQAKRGLETGPECLNHEKPKSS